MTNTAELQPGTRLTPEEALDMLGQIRDTDQNAYMDSKWAAMAGAIDSQLLLLEGDLEHLFEQS